MKRTSKIITISLVSIIVVFGLCFGIKHNNGINNKINQIKESVSDYFEHKEMTKYHDISDLMALEDEDEAWYTKYHFISHAGGGIDGKTYTNSLEAFDNSYAKGNRVFDVDMAFTSDGHLVLRHSWADGLETNFESMESGTWWTDDNGMYRNSTSEYILSYDEFASTPIFQKYTPLSCEDLLTYMQSHEDLYATIDMKDDPVESYQYLIDTANTMAIEESVLDRLIVNLYDYDLYEPIMGLYDFKNVTARQHAFSPNNYYELLRFCVEHNIHVVNVSKCYMDDEEIKLFKEYGIHVYTAIIDYVSVMNSYIKMEADGAVTNWLYEEDWGNTIGK